MIIIDVGAHDGSFFAIPKAKDPNNLVYAVEPIPELASKIKEAGLPNLHVFCAALGDTDSESTFNINHSDYTSSILDILPEASDSDWKAYQQECKTVDTIRVPVARLDTFCNDNNITEIDFL